MKELLPLGSIVLLNEGNKRIMICGRLQQEVEKDQIYDYCACYYPEGIMDPNELFLFNNEDIKNVFYIGMQDEEEFQFRTYLNEKLLSLE